MAQSLNNLGVLYRAQKKYNESEAIFQRSLAIKEKVLGSDHLDLASTLENYAAVLKQTGQNQKAANLQKRASTIRTKSSAKNQ